MRGAGAVWVNDVDLATYGFVVERWDGLDDGTGLRDAIAGVAGRVGGVLLAAEGDIPGRDVVIRGTMEGSSVTDMYARWERLKARLAQQTVEIRAGSAPDIYVVARPGKPALIAPTPQLVTRKTAAELRFHCPDPYRYAVEPTLVGFDETPTPVPLGSAPSVGLILVRGAAAGPAITYRSAGGVVRETMSFDDLPIGVNDYLAVHLDTFEIARVQAGSSVNGAEWLASGHYIMLDPHDGGDDGDSWPTIEVSSGTGVLLYRKAFT